MKLKDISNRISKIKLSILIGVLSTLILIFLLGITFNFKPKQIKPSIPPSGKKIFLPDTQPSGIKQKEEAFQLINHPDVFLSNYCPFESSEFKISSAFQSLPVGHFSFNVKLNLNDPQKAKQEFKKWLIGLGFSEDQINTLDIFYQ